MNLEEWYQWLAAFTGLLCKKHGCGCARRRGLLFAATAAAPPLRLLARRLAYGTASPLLACRRRLLAGSTLTRTPLPLCLPPCRAHPLPAPPPPDASPCLLHPPPCSSEVEVVALLQYVANQLKSSESLDLLVLKEMVQTMTVRGGAARAARMCAACAACVDALWGGHGGGGGTGLAGECRWRRWRGSGLPAGLPATCQPAC